MEHLVLDNIIQIAINNLSVWNILSVSLPKFGRYTLTNEAKLLIKRLTQHSVFERGQLVLFYKNNICTRLIGDPYTKDVSSMKEGEVLYYDIKYCYTVNKFLHCKDGPAVEFFNGSKEWYFYGERHRINGPAIEYPNGRKEWYCHGERHREDGPAIEYVNGDGEWYYHGKLHREDGPAVKSYGNKSWYRHGKLYRMDCLKLDNIILYISRHGNLKDNPDGSTTIYFDDIDNPINFNK